MFDNPQMWQTIVRVHNATKSLLIKAEEIDPSHQFFYPPIIQQRDALDHIMRAALAWIDPETIKNNSGNLKDPSEYSKRQLDKALGHVYRAFFDAADWVSRNYGIALET